MTENDILTSTSNNKEKSFVTKVLYDNEGQVYGAEILLFDVDDKPINKILVTNKTDFDKLTAFVENIGEAYPPYTEKDLENLEELQLKREEYEENDDWVAYQTFLDDLEWSKLKKIGSLEKILRNDVDETTNSYPVEINATKFMGMESDWFSKVDHTHNYAIKNHAVSTGEYGVGTKNVYGHVKIVDNLTTNSHVNGVGLSAYQGKVLSDEINNVKNKYNWSSIQNLNEWIQYKVNPDLRLVMFSYNRNHFKGFGNTTGWQVIHEAGTIPEEYRPMTRVITPLYRGDITLSYNSNGSIAVTNLTKVDDFNIYAQVMWHY